MNKAEKTLNADDILQANDTAELTPVHVPEWGGTVYQRVMSGTERDAFEASLLQRKGKQEVVDRANFRAKLLVRTTCDKDGKRLFKDNQADALGRKSGAALSRCFNVACDINGITEGDVEELAGNSEAGQNDASGSG